MFNYFITIGIEVHVTVLSNTKMFSSSRNSRNLDPNSQINEIDLGLPGTMPAPNEEVIRKAVVLAKILNMEIDKNIRFDRKNYFYQDLPKGFQITQNFFPIGKNGFLEVEIDGKLKKIEIERIHIEEDTAKQLKINGELFLDYNRSGLPLIEIVTKPNINSPKEASEFLKKLKRVLEFNSISDGKMEDGSLRADINISISPAGSNFLGKRVEIKNINSINNVEKAINFESKRQFELIINNTTILNETRKFNDENNETEFMREKTNTIDYRYMTEPNIINIKIDDYFINDSLKRYYVDLDQIKKDLLQNGLEEKMTNHILNDYLLFKYFNLINLEINDARETYKWLCIEFMGILSKLNIKTESISNFWINNIIVLIKKIKNSEINGKQAKELLRFLIEKNKNIESLIIELKFIQINDPKIIENILEKYFNENKKILSEYNTRPERVEKFFIGMVMKETNGQANPVICYEVLKEKINKL